RELPQDRRHVMVDRALGEDEPRGDLGVPKTLGDEREHLQLPSREAGGILAGRRPGATGKATDAAVSQACGDDRGRRPAAELLELVERLPEGVLVLGAGECDRSVVPTSQSGPQLGGTLRIARQLG